MSGRAELQIMFRAAHQCVSRRPHDPCALVSPIFSLAGPDLIEETRCNLEQRARRSVSPERGEPTLEMRLDHGALAGGGEVTSPRRAGHGSVAAAQYFVGSGDRRAPDPADAVAIR